MASTTSGEHSSGTTSGQHATNHGQAGQALTGLLSVHFTSQLPLLTNIFVHYFSLNCVFVYLLISIFGGFFEIVFVCVCFDRFGDRCTLIHKDICAFLFAFNSPEPVSNIFPAKSEQRTNLGLANPPNRPFQLIYQVRAGPDGP